MQSQVRFNRVPEKVAQKVWEALVTLVRSQVQVQQGSGECFGEGSGRLWYRARSGSTGFRRVSGEGSGRL